MLPAMQKPTPESNETHLDTIDHNIRRFRPKLTSYITLLLRDLTWPEAKIFKVGVKKDGRKAVPNLRQICQCILALPSKNLRGLHHPPPPVPARVNSLHAMKKKHTLEQQGNSLEATVDRKYPPISTKYGVMYDIITPWPDVIRS